MIRPTRSPTGGALLRSAVRPRLGSSRTVYRSRFDVGRGAAPAAGSGTDGSDAAGRRDARDRRHPGRARHPLCLDERIPAFDPSRALPRFSFPGKAVHNGCSGQRRARHGGRPLINDRPPDRRGRGISMFMAEAVGEAAVPREASKLPACESGVRYRLGGAGGRAGAERTTRWARSWASASPPFRAC